MKTLTLVIATIIAIGYLFHRLSQLCFDDDDPDMDWMDNYVVFDCPHINVTGVVVESSVTCETIHTICDDCKKVLNIRTDC